MQLHEAFGFGGESSVRVSGPSTQQFRTLVSNTIKAMVPKASNVFRTWTLSLIPNTIKGTVFGTKSLESLG